MSWSPRLRLPSPTRWPRARSLEPRLERVSCPLCKSIDRLPAPRFLRPRAGRRWPRSLAYPFACECGRPECEEIVEVEVATYALNSGRPGAAARSRPRFTLRLRLRADLPRVRTHVSHTPKETAPCSTGTVATLRQTLPRALVFSCRYLAVASRDSSVSLPAGVLNSKSAR